MATPKDLKKDSNQNRLKLTSTTSTASAETTPAEKVDEMTDSYLGQFREHLTRYEPSRFAVDPKEVEGFEESDRQ